jgi:integrase
MTWSEKQLIEQNAPAYLKNVIRIITETGLRVYKELACMCKDQVDLKDKVANIDDSKTPTGVAEVPLTKIALEVYRNQISIAGSSDWLFPNPRNPLGYQMSFKKSWSQALKKASVPYFRIYDLRSTQATRLSGGGAADDWVTQPLRQTDAKVFKKYSKMKLQMKREALDKLYSGANESNLGSRPSGPEKNR